MAARSGVVAIQVDKSGHALDRRWECSLQYLLMDMREKLRILSRFLLEPLKISKGFSQMVKTVQGSGRHDASQTEHQEERTSV